MVEILSQYAEDSARFQTETASRYAGRGAISPAFGTAERAQWEADRAASGIRKNRGPQRMAVGVEAPFDGPEAAYRAYDEIVSHAIDNSIVWTSRQPGTQAGIKAADAELRVMIREARRADAAAERAGARSVAGENARARTWAEITNLQQERDALKHRWELAQERAKSGARWPRAGGSERCTRAHRYGLRGEGCTTHLALLRERHPATERDR